MRKKRNIGIATNKHSDNDRITILRNELDTACEIIDSKSSTIRKLNDELSKLRTENDILRNKLQKIEGNI